MSGLILPKIKLDQPLMPVLVTSNFDDDSIKNEQASISIVYGKIFRGSRAANSVVIGPIWPKFELVRDFMHVLVTCKYNKLLQDSVAHLNRALLIKLKCFSEQNIKDRNQ